MLLFCIKIVVMHSFFILDFFDERWIMLVVFIIATWSIWNNIHRYSESLLWDNCVELRWLIQKLFIVQALGSYVSIEILIWCCIASSFAPWSQEWFTGLDPSCILVATTAHIRTNWQSLKWRRIGIEGFVNIRVRVKHCRLVSKWLS